MSYEMDRKNEDWRLADYVKYGIQFLDNDTGFFIMVEGGKIDWACHANDAATAIAETMVFDESIQVAIDFYEEHPTETLILVTGDHECGGLTIGSVETNYDTYLSNLSNHRISFAKFNSEYITSYKENQTEFPSVCHDIENLVGLKVLEEMQDTKSELNEMDQHKHETNAGSLVMTAYEYARLKEAYNQTLTKDKKPIVSEAEYNAYGSYEPLTVTITHILNHKCGVSFSTYAHSALPVPVFAHGLGAKAFQGYYDNMDIYKKLATITGILP